MSADGQDNAVRAHDISVGLSIRMVSVWVLRNRESGVEQPDEEREGDRCRKSGSELINVRMGVLVVLVVVVMRVLEVLRRHRLESGLGESSVAPLAGDAEDVPGGLLEALVEGRDDAVGDSGETVLVAQLEDGVAGLPERRRMNGTEVHQVENFLEDGGGGLDLDRLAGVGAGKVVAEVGTAEQNEWK